jgi:uncharacterized protein YhhL (DUF1145 family)
MMKNRTSDGRASALRNVVVPFPLARRRFKASIAIVLCALFYLLSVYLFHSTVPQIAAASGIFNAVALLAGICTVFRLRPAGKGL